MRCHGRKPSSGTHHPGQNTPMNTQNPAIKHAAPSPIASRYHSFLINAAVRTSDSVAMATKEASTASHGCAASCRPHCTGAFTESVMKWYLTVPLRTQLVHPGGTVSFAHAAAANATPNARTGTQTL